MAIPAEMPVIGRPLAGPGTRDIGEGDSRSGACAFVTTATSPMERSRVMIRIIRIALSAI